MSISIKMPVLSHIKENSEGAKQVEQSQWHFFIAKLREHSAKSWVQILLQTLMIFVFFLVGCAYYHQVEGWDFGTSLVFQFVTISTVGYGYQYPTTDNSRLFTIFYMLFGIYFIFIAVSAAITAQFESATEYVKQQAKADTIGQSLRHHRYTLLCIAMSCIVVVIFGGLVFMTLEDWSFIKGVYFAVQTSTTVGYGDLPIRNGYGTNLFLIFYITLSTITFAFAFNQVSLLRVEQEQAAQMQELLARRRDLGFIADLDQGNGVTEGTFILAILEHLGTLDFDKDIKPWKDKFKELDVANTGVVRHNDLVEFSHRESVIADDKISKMNHVAVSGSISEDLRQSISGIGRSSSVGGGPLSSHSAVGGMGSSGGSFTTINSPLQQQGATSTARVIVDSNHRRHENIETGGSIRPSTARTKAQNELLSHYL